jgi:hypothetical protein
VDECGITPRCIYSASRVQACVASRSSVVGQIYLSLCNGPCFMVLARTAPARGERGDKVAKRFFGELLSPTAGT